MSYVCTPRENARQRRAVMSRWFTDLHLFFHSVARNRKIHACARDGPCNYEYQAFERYMSANATARNSATVLQRQKAVVLYRNASMRYGHLNLFQTEADVAQMESLQRDQAAMEGQDPTEQRHLEMLAHAV